MSTYKVFDLALAAKVELDVDVSSWEIVVTPRERITPELREGIRENRGELLRDLLIAKARRHLSRIGARSRRSVWDEFPQEQAAADEVNKLYADGSLEEFKDAARAWLSAATRKVAA